MNAELQDLRTLSAELGSNLLLVQAAGGNTSIKQDGVMWIKASGTWLRDAVTKDIFVPLDLAALKAALERDDPACESCADFVRGDLNATGLRPSIETSVHGLMRSRVVLHVHCVNTISWAIQAASRVLLAQRLAEFRWAYVPYARPGLQLCRAIRKAIIPDTNVLVLENHGLAVAADTVAEAEALLRRVVRQLERPARLSRPADQAALHALAAETDYRLPADEFCHNFAMEDWSCAKASSASYYPDHPLFLGNEIPSDPASGAPALAFPGKGVLIHKDARAAVEPMLVCLSHVFARLAPEDELRSITLADVGQLLNWDAEKYRLELNKR